MGHRLLGKDHAKDRNQPLASPRQVNPHIGEFARRLNLPASGGDHADDGDQTALFEDGMSICEMLSSPLKVAAGGRRLGLGQSEAARLQDSAALEKLIFAEGCLVAEVGDGALNLTSGD